MTIWNRIRKKRLSAIRVNIEAQVEQVKFAAKNRIFFANVNFKRVKKFQVGGRVSKFRKIEIRGQNRPAKIRKIFRFGTRIKSAYSRILQKRRADWITSMQLVKLGLLYLLEWRTDFILMRFQIVKKKVENELFLKKRAKLRQNIIEII